MIRMNALVLVTPIRNGLHACLYRSYRIVMLRFHVPDSICCRMRKCFLQFANYRRCSFLDSPDSLGMPISSNLYANFLIAAISNASLRTLCEELFDWLTYWNELKRMTDAPYIRHNFFNMFKIFWRVKLIMTGHKRIQPHSCEHGQRTTTCMYEWERILLKSYSSLRRKLTSGYFRSCVRSP